MFAAAGVEIASLASANHALLTTPKEITLMKRLAGYPEMLASAAALHAPHTVAYWLRDCAGGFSLVL